MHYNKLHPDIQNLALGQALGHKISDEQRMEHIEPMEVIRKTDFTKKKKT